MPGLQDHHVEIWLEQSLQCLDRTGESLAASYVSMALDILRNTQSSAVDPSYTRVGDDSERRSERS